MAQDEERDEDLEPEDTDLEDENSDDEGEDKDEKDEDEDSDDDSESDKDDEDEEDNKPVTRKEFREALKGKNRSNAQRRVDPKNKERHNSNSPKTEERLNRIEQSQKKVELLETKRQFGHDNNLSPKQVDVVFRMTKRPTAKFLKQSYVKAAIDVIAAEDNVRGNTPTSGGSKGFKNRTGKSWDKMEGREKQENFADRRRAILDSKNRR